MPEIAFFKVAVSAFIVKRNRILLLKRSENADFLPGTWEVPGGTIEEGETIKQGVARETKEEAGLTIIPSELLGYFEYTDGKNRKSLNLNFLCKMEDESEIVNIGEDEMSDFLWADEEKISTLPFTSDTMRDICLQALQGNQIK